jgi:AraC-like DNA-binding protein
MTTSQLLIGVDCFIVIAHSLPNGYNQRPGVTLLVSSVNAPLELEIEGQPVRSAGFVLAPELRRRFKQPQPHISITIEPGHVSYSRLLAWARLSPLKYQQLDEAAGVSGFTSLANQFDLQSRIDYLLDIHHQPISTPNPKLDYLLTLLDQAGTEATAEVIWQLFRRRYPSTQAHCSHWLQGCIGIPLRKLLLWRKMRRALDMLSDAKPLTEVAHAAGFADSAHLSRICLRTFGLNPSQANDHKILQANRLS